MALVQPSLLTKVNGEVKLSNGPRLVLTVWGVQMAYLLQDELGFLGGNTSSMKAEE